MLLRHGCWALMLSLLVAGVCSAQDIETESTDYRDPSAPVEFEKPKLLGLVRATDPSFNNFVSPMTNPVYFEDPRNVSEVRAIFLNNTIPSALGGNQAQLYAAQVRAALTENLSLVAAKDGYIVSQNPLLEDGFADVSVGLKYLAFKNVASQTLASVGFAYSLPIGSTQALQGRCDGEFNLYATGGTEILPNIHYVTTSGFRLPSNANQGNQIWYWSNHLDWQIGGSKWYLFTEENWYHYMSGANALPLPVGGMDLFNLGATGIGGQNTVTGAYGLKYKPRPNIETGICYEIPYSQRHDIMQNRLTVDLIIRY